jgi:hypothetical protein
MTTNTYASGSPIPHGIWSHIKFIQASANNKISEYSYLKATDGVTTQNIAQGSFVFPTTVAAPLTSYIDVPEGLVLTPTGVCYYIIDVLGNKIGGGSDPTLDYYTGDGYPTRLETPDLGTPVFATTPYVDAQDTKLRNMFTTNTSRNWAYMDGAVTNQTLSFTNRVWKINAVSNIVLNVLTNGLDTNRMYEAWVIWDGSTNGLTITGNVKIASGAFVTNAGETFIGFVKSGTNHFKCNTINAP